MCEQNNAPDLLSFPFIGLHSQVDEVLAQKCTNTLNPNSGVQYHKVLYAWRIKRGDFRGAASVLHERLQRLQASGMVPKADESETPITQGYLALINVLASVDEKQAWILSEQRKTQEEAAAKRLKTATGKCTLF